MAATPLEIAGALKRTEEGAADWYYGGGSTAWASLLDAYNGIPSEVRKGKHFGVWVDGIKIEYVWKNIDEIANGDEVEVGSGSGSASIDDSVIALETTWSSTKINSELDNKVDKEIGKGLSANDYSDEDKTKVDSISVIFLGYFSTLSQLQTEYPTGTAGQFGIVGADRYLWDGDSWEVYPDAIGDTFVSDFTVKLGGGKTFGKYSNNQTVPASGKTPAEVILMASIETVPPTYTAPSSSVSLNQNSNNLEVGQSVNVTITSTFNQNDGGSLTSISVKKDSVEIGNTNPYVDNAVVVSTVNKVYQVALNYDQGAIKNDNLGNPYPTGRIPSGQTVTNLASLRGFYKSFWGNVSAQPSSSADVRALSSSRLENGVSGNAFTLNTGTINSKFVIVLAPGKSLVSVVDQDALNLDITGEYTLVNSNMTVNDASGTPVAGFKMYVKTNSVPYSTNHRHNIIIS